MHQETRFPLTGSHAGLDCEVCHRGAAQGQLQFRNTSSSCEDCHLDDYRAAQTPDHETSGFPLDCTECHTPIAWHAANFDHDATAFPLTGAHRGAACAACHGDGVYHGKGTDCASCHMAEYDGAEPDHQAARFPASECASCHSTSTWDGASFDHAATSFPLTGAHVAAPCASCHGDGVYSGKSTDCASCHMAEYDGAEPDHQAAGFPASECETCHGTTTWSGATFDHDTQWFPIYSGRHRTEWNDCSDCHTNPTNFSVFTCLSCHPHSDRAETDGHHREESGYQYESGACYDCHPDGRSD